MPFIKFEYVHVGAEVVCFDQAEYIHTKYVAERNILCLALLNGKQSLAVLSL